LTGYTQKSELFVGK